MQNALSLVAFSCSLIFASNDSAVEIRTKDFASRVNGNARGSFIDPRREDEHEEEDEEKQEALLADK